MLALVLAAGAVSLPIHAQEAAEGIILSEESLQTAPVAELKTDIVLFDTIRKGMTLSLAQCEFDSTNCDLTVDKEELDRILDALNKRIIALTTRHAQSGEAELEPVLLTYAETRDAYSAVKEQYIALAPPEKTESLTASIFEGGTDAGAMPAEYDVFNDAGEELIDDSGEDFVGEEPLPR